MTIYIASDHAGFELKEKIIKNYAEFKDLGPYEYRGEDDYPDYVYLLVKRVKKDLENNSGVLICKNGTGVCIASNKFKEIRAGLGLNTEHIKSMISDDNINVLCLPADFLKEEEIIKMVEIFQSEKFQPENRHLRRLNKLSIIENSEI
jgi:RpiB/LacA/LacB family sugar-phosphate isomerase